MNAARWISLVILCPSVVTGQSRGDNDAARDLVREGLWQEARGKFVERDSLIDRALRLDPQCQVARWASGQVELGRRWARFDSLDLSPRHRMRYEAKRARASTPEQQWQLAQWCEAQKMPDRALSAALQVLKAAPDHSAAERLVSSRQVADVGLWLTEAELAASLEKWGGEVNALVAALTAGGRRARDAAESWERIADPGAAAAIEQLIAGRDPRLAEVAVLKLAQLPGAMPSRALARLALVAHWPSVRGKAAAALADRPPEGFVPELLDELSMPIERRRQTAIDGASYRSRDVFVREGRNQRQVVILDDVKVHRGERPRLQEVDRREDPTVLRGPEAASVMLGREMDRQRREFLSSVALDAQQRSSELMLQNAWIDWNNRRVSAVLTAATGEVFAAPNQWWDWWRREQERTQGAKPSYYQYRHEREGVYTPTETPVIYHNRGYSCFAPGTKVLTETGPRPIESIRPGDRVLSQFGGSGELALQVVLDTTLRPPTQTWRLTMSSGRQITATGGHPLWVSGEGWVLVKNLRPGIHLHTVQGAVTLAAIQPGPMMATHNLVVGGWRSYFVGDDHILCHDNRQHDDESAIVPGLLRP